MRAFILGVIGVLSSSAFADLIVPNSTGTNTTYLFSPSGGATHRDYYEHIPASLLTDIIGQDINGISLRGRFSGTGSSSMFKIVLFPGDESVSHTETTVRTAGLSIAANNSQLGTWLPVIGFDQNYHYTGGDLSLRIITGSENNGGFGQQIGFESAFPAEALGITAHQEQWYTGGGSDSFPSATPLVINFSTVPEPASVAVLGLGALALVRRRRK